MENPQEERRTQFTFYASFFESASRIKNKSHRADLYDALCRYALTGEEPDLDKLSDAAAVAFISARPNLDASRRKAKSGKDGGSKPKANGKQTASKTENAESEKENEKEKEGEKEKENECYMAQTIVCLPLNDGTEFPVTEAMVSEFSALYPAVDVEQSLRNMRGWLLNNPKNRKTSSGIRRFMNSWLSREQDRARPKQKQSYTHGSDRLAEMIAGGAFDD